MAKKIEVPEYVLDNTIRHMERMIEMGQPKVNSTKASEAFRLGRNDVKILKRLKEKANDNK